MSPFASISVHMPLNDDVIPSLPIQILFCVALLRCAPIFSAKCGVHFFLRKGTLKTLIFFFSMKGPQAFHHDSRGITQPFCSTPPITIPAAVCRTRGTAFHVRKS
ncbi:hypothetical protein, unlikely [Trypanosoma brucei gambiense DAL972]|uniref:Uncharacterized protein n=1 Tax=Trypanosoma brucei gambiense (strain MHOM/CI/86/DAL972) TaxID=679716 RepID=C9ZPC2_TRYB9|nr:hypothetical protein, unlikely [Trypanosoma brucei gambiense DAL972]CBH11250.1 hypothetical protein, unlikely [Trypanosoma brucei gambiense DAL972]|eukprot:XP_011773537.1 hypothetical protein, unlikely [Trypanosoma brucei gambiense DAL972]